ncbi:MAG: hypothetical protein Q7Q73_04650 [Verrucomicrobiota bacterium JB024]|nr:hypothetical protein [Verrucomicrobiota bacterium JB024]
MPSLKLIPALLFLLVPGLVQAEYRDFTDQQGRTMNAELINVMGDQVRLKRSDGAVFNVDPSVFCPEDQEIIRVWMLTTLSQRDALLKINAKAAGTTPKSIEGVEGVDVEQWDGYYRVDLENTSDTSLENIEIRYCFLAFHMKVAADKRREGKTEIVKGSLTIPSIKPRDDFSFDTIKADMMNTALQKGYVWADGGKDDSKDKLDGIWIRLYYQGHFISEWSSPSSMKEKYDWAKLYK